MKAITDKLKGNFVVLDLGSSSAGENKFLNKFSKAVSLVEIDAIEPDLDVNQDTFYQRVVLKSAVYDREGVFPFYRRKYFPCSSFLTVNTDIARSYGLEDSYTTETTIDLECTTLVPLLQKENIRHVDFFKTDLEGLDFSIIRSSEHIVQTSLAIQFEARFQPINNGEPYFYEVCAYLDKLGFEIIHLKPEYWKFDTANNKYWRDGRLVWGDFIFFMKEEKIREQFGSSLQDALLKQVLIAKTLDLNSYAEYLFEKNTGVFDAAIRSELELVLRPQKNLKYQMLNFFAAVSGKPFFRTIRRYVWKLYSAMYVDKYSKWMVK